MESSRRRKAGFIKGKLVKSLYRSAPPTVIPSLTTSPINCYSSEDTSSQTIYHLQVHHHHHQPKEKLVPFNPNNIIALSISSFIVNQEQAAPPQKPKVSYYIPPQGTNGTHCTGTNYSYAKMVDKSYGDDESIDMKASHYISCVQERFRSLELTC